MRTPAERRILLALVAATGASFGCASRPTRQPKILSSYAPPGAQQPLPLNSRQAIQVPTADVGARAPAIAVPAQPAPQAVPAVPGPPPGAVVPAQPQVVPGQPVPQPQMQQQQQQQIVPQQHLVPAHPGQQPAARPPQNSRQFEEQDNRYDWSQPDRQDQNQRRLIAPDPGDLNS